MHTTVAGLVVVVLLFSSIGTCVGAKNDVQHLEGVILFLSAGAFFFAFAFAMALREIIAQLRAQIPTLTDKADADRTAPPR